MVKERIQKLEALTDNRPHHKGLFGDAAEKQGLKDIYKLLYDAGEIAQKFNWVTHAENLRAIKFKIAKSLSLIS